jgi:hypothetical protein
MPLEIQMRLRENPLYIKYLRENSSWYKKLIRNPNSFNEFKDEMRIEYKLRPIDKISKTVDTLNIVTNIFNNML